MAWGPVNERENLVAGETYRLTLWIKAPYSRFLAERIRDAVRFGVGLRNWDPFRQLKEYTAITQVTWAPPAQNTRTGRSELWPIAFTMRKITKNPVPAVIYGLIALIIAATTAVLIAGTKWERLVESTTGAVNENLLKPIFNPGVVLAAFIVAVMVIRR